MAHGIQVRLAALAWATALAVAPLAAQGRDPREINGAKAPERIPDRYAYPMLFHRLTGPDAAGGRGIFLRDSRMGSFRYLCPEPKTWSTMWSTTRRSSS